MSSSPALEAGRIVPVGRPHQISAEQAHKLTPTEKRQLQPEDKHRFSVPWCAKGFPIEPSRNRIILLMVEPEDVELESGIIIPATSDERDRVQGIVMACGPGEYLFDGRFVSMEFDDDIYVGDILFIEGRVGLNLDTDQISYRVITPNEVIGKLRRNLGQGTAERLKAALEKATKKHKDKGDMAGEDTARPQKLEDFSRRPYVEEPEEVAERRASTRGKGTKTQISVPPGAPGGAKKGG